MYIISLVYFCIRFTLSGKPEGVLRKNEFDGEKKEVCEENHTCQSFLHFFNKFPDFSHKGQIKRLVLPSQRLHVDMFFVMKDGLAVAVYLEVKLI